MLRIAPSASPSKATKFNSNHEKHFPVSSIHCKRYSRVYIGCPHWYYATVYCMLPNILYCTVYSNNVHKSFRDQQTETNFMEAIAKNNYWSTVLWNKLLFWWFCMWNRFQEYFPFRFKNYQNKAHFLGRKKFAIPFFPLKMRKTLGTFRTLLWKR